MHSSFKSGPDGTVASPVPALSVVIPTYNRLDTLPEVVSAVEGQVGVPDFEVIIIDDGSTDGTWEWLEQRTPSVPTKVVRQSHSGPAAARNRGVETAVGRWVAFLGDDTVPSPQWLAYHLAAQHQGRKGDETVAVVGYTGWHPRIRVTAFIRYLNEYGPQFGYALIEHADNVPFNFFYSSNLSISRQLLLEQPFDTTFPYPAWEDIELGYRLKGRGLRILYCREAEVAHSHPTGVKRYCERQWQAGYSAILFCQRHPELASFLGLGPDGPPELPPRFRHVAQRFLAQILLPLPLRLETLWEEVLKYHYIAGLRQAWADGLADDKAKETIARLQSFFAGYERRRRGEEALAQISRMRVATKKFD